MAGASPTPNANDHSSGDSHGFSSSSPHADPEYGDEEPFDYFGDGHSQGEEQDSNSDLPDLPDDPFQDLPQPDSGLPLRSFTGTAAQNAQQPNPFCQINDYINQHSRDVITQLMNSPPGQSFAERLLDSVTSRVVSDQRAAIGAASTQASQNPTMNTNTVFGSANPNREFGGYEELEEPPQMLSGIGGYAEVPANDRDDNSRPLHVSHQDPFRNRNVFADILHDPFHDTSNTASVNQQPFEGYMPAEDDYEAFPKRKRVSNSTRRRCAGINAPRAHGNRIHPPRSDPHPRFLTSDPQAQRDAGITHTIDRTHHSGRNLMALFDNSDTPRTRYRLRVEKGRAGQYAAAGYPEAHTELPARLSLREICQHFPNHVWGNGLRLFMHEYIRPEQIWRDLPDNVRMKGCKGRMHNYLQQAIGRQIDAMMLEETGEKRVIIPRNHDGDKDEDDEEKPKKTRKPTITPQIHQLVLPQASQPNLLPGLQHSTTSPFVLQNQQGLAHPGRFIQRPATTNTPVPAGGGMAPGQPSQVTPPRTASDLRHLITAELEMQDDMGRERLLAQCPSMSEEELQARMRSRRANVNEQFNVRLMLAYSIQRNPVPDNSTVSMMLWILANRAGGRIGSAERLATRDINSVALNWYLHKLRELTQHYRGQMAVAEAGEA